MSRDHVQAALQRAQSEERARATLRAQDAPQGVPAIGDVAKYLKQFTEHPLKLPLTNGDYRSVDIHMRGTLTTATTSTTDDYKLPSTHHLLIHEVRGVIGFNDGDGETLSIAGIGNPGVLDRIALKAMNCRVTMKNLDREETIVGENRAVALSSLMELVGGRPVEYRPPHIVLAGQILQTSVELQDTASALVGGSTDYGLLVHGTLVRARRG